VQERDRAARPGRRLLRAQSKADRTGQPYSDELRQIDAIGRDLALDEGPRLIRAIEESRFLSQAPIDVRIRCLLQIAAFMARARIRAGLDPIDDALPFERPTAWPRIRRALG
jgi:hypothetical protein